MEIWIIITLIMAGVVFGIDYLLRRKKWKDNSNVELFSLLVNMFSVGPYGFLSMLGMFWGLVDYYPESNFGQLIYEATLRMAGTYFIIAFIVIIMTFILRKIGKNKISIVINVIALVYIVLVLAINCLVAQIL